jgi:MoxR-vWA-beta-propeller ternary system domain bpX4
MKLTHFLTNLIQEGKAHLEGEIQPFEPEDLKSAAAFLHSVYLDDALDMPDAPPQYFEPAALWAAQFLYHALQCTILRNLDDDTVNKLLEDFPEAATPEAIYSIDLCFRYMPNLFSLAKGLAPDDVLVKILKKNALFWNFSSVGMDLEQDVSHGIILEHPSLRIAYIDRIIQSKDIKRVNTEQVKELVQIALGNYTTQIWSDFDLKK